MNAVGNSIKYNFSLITGTLSLKVSNRVISFSRIGMLYNLITGTLLIGILSYLTHNDKLVKLPHI